MLTMTMTKMLAAAALVLGLAACGTADPGGTTPSTSAATTPSTAAPSEPATTPPPDDVAAARKVTMLRGGGLRPAPLTRVFALDRPPPHGFSRTDVTAVLKAAGAPALRRMPPTTPANTCCDLYIYRITVTWRDDTSTTFTTVDGAADPAPLDRLLSLIS